MHHEPVILDRDIATAKKNLKFDSTLVGRANYFIHITKTTNLSTPTNSPTKKGTEAPTDLEWRRRFDPHGGSTNSIKCKITDVDHLKAPDGQKTKEGWCLARHFGSERQY